MEGIIVNFRKGKHTKYNNHMIIKIQEIDKKDKALKLVGKKLTWKSPSGKEIKGTLVSSHGNSGCLRAIFEKGMPGQSISQKVKID